MATFPVPSPWSAEQWSATLVEALIRQSALLASPITRVASDSRVVHLPRLTVHPTAEWVAEAAELPSDSGTEDVLQLVPRKIGNVTTLSRESIEDASVDMLDSFGQALVKGLSHALDATAFGTAAESATTPAGLLNGLTADAAPTGGTSGSNLSIDDVLDGVGQIEGVGGVANAVYLSAADATAIRKAKASTGGQYLALPGGSVTGDISAPGVEMIGGARFYVSPGLSAGTAVVADSSYIQLAMRRDIEVDFSTEAAFTSDSVVARVTARLDWALGDRNAIYYIAPAA